MAYQDRLNPNNRRRSYLPQGHLLVKIAESSGFSILQLQKLEKSLNFYAGKSEFVGDVLSENSMPSARQLMKCLFQNKSTQKTSEYETGRQTSELHFCTNSSRGRLSMIARITIEKKDRVFRQSQSIARLRIAYKLLSSNGIIENHLDIILSGNDGFHVRRRNERTVARNPLPHYLPSKALAVEVV